MVDIPIASAKNADLDIVRASIGTLGGAYGSARSTDGLRVTRPVRPRLPTFADWHHEDQGGNDCSTRLAWGPRETLRCDERRARGRQPRGPVLKSMPVLLMRALVRGVVSVC